MAGYNDDQKAIREAIKSLVSGGPVSENEMNKLLEEKMGRIPSGQERGNLMFGLVLHEDNIYRSMKGKRPKKEKPLEEHTEYDIEHMVLTKEGTKIERKKVKKVTYWLGAIAWFTVPFIMNWLANVFRSP